MTKTTTVASWVRASGILRVDSDLPQIGEHAGPRFLQEVAQVIANGIDGDEALAGVRQRPAGDGVEQLRRLLVVDRDEVGDCDQHFPQAGGPLP